MFFIVCEKIQATTTDLNMVNIHNFSHRLTYSNECLMFRVFTLILYRIQFLLHSEPPYRSVCCRFTLSFITIVRRSQTFVHFLPIYWWYNYLYGQALLIVVGFQLLKETSPCTIFQNTMALIKGKQNVCAGRVMKL